MTSKASFWIRYLAFIFDNFLCSILVVLIGMIFHLPEFAEYWIYFLVFYSYNTFMEYWYQQTLGKMLCNIHVVKTNGQRMDLWTAFCRNMWKIVSALPFLYGYFRILNPNQRQTIHDEFAKCYVITTRHTKSNKG